MTSPSGALQTIRSLSENGNKRSVRKGEVIFRSQEPGDCLYGVVEGSVRLGWGDGELHETIGPGSCFGIGALVDPEHRRYGTATAETDGQLLVMNREEFLFAVQELPVFGLEMLHDLDARLRALKGEVSATEAFRSHREDSPA